VVNLRNQVTRYLNRWTQQIPERYQLLGFALISGILTTLLLAQSTQKAPVDYKVGDVVRTTITAPADIELEDSIETRKRRELAQKTVRPTFRFDPRKAEESTQKFRNSWAQLKEEESSSVVPNPSARKAIVAHRFNEQDLERLTRILVEVYGNYIYEDLEAENLGSEIKLIDVRTGLGTIISRAQSRLISLSDARNSLRSRLLLLSDWTPEEQSALASMMLPLIQPNIFFDRLSTEEAGKRAAESVNPMTVSMKRNQVIARQGDSVTPQMLEQFEAINNYARTKRRPHHYIGLLAIVLALYWAAWKFTEHRSSTRRILLPKTRAFYLVCTAVFVQTFLIKIGIQLTSGLSSTSLPAPFNDPTMYGFAIPFASGALLVMILVDSQLGFLTGLITALFAGVISPLGIGTAFYAMISSAASVYGIRRYRERQSVTMAGLVVAVSNMIMAMAIVLYVQQPLTINTVISAIGFGLAGGLLTTIFTAGILPINESVFGILTDVKLLELSNTDLPILNQLALRAAGTNQHSHAVGQLAEEACRAIGANALLARVGALYHDIGKLAAPDMFIENQHGDNPHDRLRPTNSARIVISHVTYGIKLANELGLPKEIVDFIPEHHGTRTLHFFYKKAQEQAEEGEVLDEAEFRYPGPKPQTKETAIMMIADSCEAAARSLARPDEQNIRVIVGKILDAILSDGQLDECDLDLYELRQIKEVMVGSLTAIYHPRIDYPGFNPPAQKRKPDIESGNSYTDASQIPISRGGEIEDEAIPSRAATDR
jgi:cyclic-di-AMP phosphodiesterase PgpH